MPNKKFRYNAGWIGKSLTCDSCGETRGVKYIVGDEHWCNKCVVYKIVAAPPEEEPVALPKTLWDEYMILSEFWLMFCRALVRKLARMLSKVTNRIDKALS